MIQSAVWATGGSVMLAMASSSGDAPLYTGLGSAFLAVGALFFAGALPVLFAHSGDDRVYRGQ